MSIYPGYYYLVNGRVMRSYVYSKVADVKRMSGAKVIRNYSLADRNIDPYGE